MDREAEASGEQGRGSLVNWTALAISGGICAAVAVLEGLLTGDGLKTWYPRLRKPRWHLPMWGFVAVAVLVYLIDGFVAYRALTAVASWEGRIVVLTALMVVMVLNALWNYAYFRYRSTLIGLLGLIGFLGPLVVLQVALFAYDTLAALVHMPYLIWVILYDLPLFYALWHLNTTQNPDGP